MSADSAAAFAELPEMNPGPVFRLCLEGRIELANRAARDLFHGDVLGRSWLELCPGLSAGVWKDVLSGADGVQCEVVLQGRTFLFELAHRAGSPNVFVYGHDVSTLKQAEIKLSEQAAALREMAEFPEMNPGPVCRVDTDGKILLANRAARTLLGREHVTGESWFDLCPGVNRAFFERVMGTAGSLAIESRIGSRDYVFTHTHAPSGQEVFVYGADVTDQKAAERTLLQTEKMATLGTLAAGVAHELNNPAAAASRASTHLREDFGLLQRAQLQLGGFNLTPDERACLLALHDRARHQAVCACDLDGLRRGEREEELERWLEAHGISESWERAPQLVEFNLTVEDLDAVAAAQREAHLAAVLEWVVHLHSVYRLLEEIHHGAGRVSEIVGALRSYSYLGEAPVQDIDVNEGVRQTLIILRNKLKQSVRVVQELAADLPRIPAYGSELNQVWTNLIDNAVGAMDGQGTLILRSRRDEDAVVVEVQDDGPGIPDDIVTRIFDPFFTTKPPGQGTGLGLHTCHEIVVKKHGGTLDVVSRTGETRFVVRLPTTRPDGALPD